VGSPADAPFLAHRSVCFGGARGYFTLARRPSSHIPNVSMGPPQISKTKIASIRERVEPVETLQRNVLTGIGLNAVLKDLSPEALTNVD